MWVLALILIALTFRAVSDLLIITTLMDLRLLLETALWVDLTLQSKQRILWIFPG